MSSVFSLIWRNRPEQLVFCGGICYHESSSQKGKTEKEIKRKVEFAMNKKKLFSALLGLVMVFSMMAPAMAAEEDIMLIAAPPAEDEKIFV